MQIQRKTEAKILLNTLLMIQSINYQSMEVCPYPFRQIVIEITLHKFNSNTLTMVIKELIYQNRDPENLTQVFYQRPMLCLYNYNTIKQNIAL